MCNCFQENTEIETWSYKYNIFILPTLKKYSNFILSFNVPCVRMETVRTTSNEQGLIWPALSVAVHVTVLVPTGKEPFNWLPFADMVIWLLEGDTAVHATFRPTVPQLSWTVGRANETSVFTPVDVGFMSGGHNIVGGSLSETVKRGILAERQIYNLWGN